MIISGGKKRVFYSSISQVTASYYIVWCCHVGLWLMQVTQYVRTYLGNSSETMTFVQQYLQKREIWRQQNKMLQVCCGYCGTVLLHRTETSSLQQ